LESITRRNRKRKILDILEARGTMDIEELANILGVSPITLRRDLKDLERQGLVSKVWGGVTLSPHSFLETPIEDRGVENLDEKRAIARTALTLIKPGDIVGLGGGTTTYELAKLLRSIPNVQVVTNAVNIAYLLIRLGVKVIMPGGYSREGSYTLNDNRIEEFFKSTYMDKCFLGADGIDIDMGLTTTNPAEVPLITAMLSSSNLIVVLADYSKIGRKRLIPVVPLEKIHVLITDEKAPQNILSFFEKKGIKIEIASLTHEPEIYSQSEYKFK